MVMTCATPEHMSEPIPLVLPPEQLCAYCPVMTINDENVNESVGTPAQPPVAPPIVQMPPKPTVDQFGNSISPKSRLAAALLAWFLGIIGVHRFYVGKVGTGVLMIFTLGGLGIWALIDFIVILVGSFKDKEGRLLLNWS